MCLFNIVWHCLQSSSEQLVVESVLAIAVCHNVTPIMEEEEEDEDERVEHVEDEEVVVFSRANSNKGRVHISYQASSPDEV